MTPNLNRRTVLSVGAALAGAPLFPTLGVVAPGGNGFHRETTLDRLYFDPDGAIRPVIPILESMDPLVYTGPGAPAVGLVPRAVPGPGQEPSARPHRWPSRSIRNRRCPPST